MIEPVPSSSLLLLATLFLPSCQIHCHWRTKLLPFLPRSRQPWRGGQVQCHVWQISWLEWHRTWACLLGHRLVHVNKWTYVKARHNVSPCFIVISKIMACGERWRTPVRRSLSLTGQRAPYRFPWVKRLTCAKHLNMFSIVVDDWGL